MSFTLSPSSGTVTSSIPVVATGFQTRWLDEQAAFYVSGGTDPEITGLTVISNTQAVFTVQTGQSSGPLTITNSQNLDTATFTVTGAMAGAPLSASYDPTTPLGQLRFLVGDTDVSSVDPTVPREQWSCVFADQELQLFLDKWPGDVDQAAIMALHFLAARPELQAHAIHVLNLDMEIGDIPAALNDLADEIQKARVTFPYEDIAEVGNTDADYRRILFNRLQRAGFTGP